MARPLRHLTTIQNHSFIVQLTIVMHSRCDLGESLYPYELLRKLVLGCLIIPLQVYHYLSHIMTLECTSN